MKKEMMICVLAAIIAAAGNAQAQGVTGTVETSAEVSAADGAVTAQTTIAVYADVAGVDVEPLRDGIAHARTRAEAALASSRERAANVAQKVRDRAEGVVGPIREAAGEYAANNRSAIDSYRQTTREAIRTNAATTRDMINDYREMMADNRVELRERLASTHPRAWLAR